MTKVRILTFDHKKRNQIGPWIWYNLTDIRRSRPRPGHNLFRATAWYIVWYLFELFMRISRDPFTKCPFLDVRRLIKEPFFQSGSFFVYIRSINRNGRGYSVSLVSVKIFFVWRNVRFDPNSAGSPLAKDMKKLNSILGRQRMVFQSMVKLDPIFGVCYNFLWLIDISWSRHKRLIYRAGIINSWLLEQTYQSVNRIRFHNLST